MRHFLLLTLFLLPFCVTAQLSESFDGPDITSSYPWQGSLERFIINDQNELQLNARRGSGKDHLYISSVPLWDNEWSWRVRSDYKGTSSNCFHIYLWSQNCDIPYTGEAILVRIGNNKDNDIDLCYQRGNIETKPLIKGRSLCKDAYDIEIKVTIDENGFCTLFSKTPDEEDFVEEGSCELNYMGDDGYFMIATKYSTTHATDKYIDDIRISRFTLNDEKEQPEQPEYPISLLLLEQEDAHTLYLYFNRYVDVYESVFTLSDMGEADEVHQSVEGGDIIKLIWFEPMENDKEYTLSYMDVLDETGYPYADDYVFTATFSEDPIDPPTPGTESSYEVRCILINEVMADPKGLTELPETEYVELWNVSQETIETEGWSFVYGGKLYSLNNYSFPPDSYVVLFNEKNEIDAGNGFAMALKSFPQLANAGKDLQLIDPYEKVIDSIIYEKAKSGKSWERAGNDWYLCYDRKGGTPGNKNSNPSDPEIPPTDVTSTVEYGEIIFNELLPNPYKDESEYIELYNRSGKSLSLQGLSVAIRKADGSLSTKYPLAETKNILEPDGYLLITKSAESIFNCYTVKYSQNIYEIKIPVLNNTGATLVLFREHDEEIIDEITYSSKWHDSSVKDQKGVALERTDPDKDTQDEENWTSAAAIAGYGTPGYQNSQHGNTPGPEIPSGIDKPVYDKESGIYSILYYLDQPGYRCRAYVYDLSGKKVADITNNELIGTNGAIQWEGFGNSGTRLKTGLYILYIELYHNEGSTKTYKEVFLVH